MRRVAPESFSKVFESLRVHDASHVKSDSNSHDWHASYAACTVWNFQQVAFKTRIDKGRSGPGAKDPRACRRSARYGFLHRNWSAPISNHINLNYSLRWNENSNQKNIGVSTSYTQIQTDIQEYNRMKNK